MAQAAQKITLSPSRDIPFDKLVLSQSTVRRIKAGVSVEELAEDMVDNYLNGVPKARILEALHETKGEGTAQLLDHLRKGEMATEAERLLKGTGWLPEVLRRSDLAAFEGEASVEGQGASVEDATETVDNAGEVDLPAFLVADLPNAAASMMAAE